jgi:hypothetical protein
MARNTTKKTIREATTDEKVGGSTPSERARKPGQPPSSDRLVEAVRRRGRSIPEMAPDELPGESAIFGMTREKQNLLLTQPFGLTLDSRRRWLRHVVEWAVVPGSHETASVGEHHQPHPPRRPPTRRQQAQARPPPAFRGEQQAGTDRRQAPPAQSPAPTRRTRMRRTRQRSPPRRRRQPPPARLRRFMPPRRSTSQSGRSRYPGCPWSASRPALSRSPAPG